MGIVLAAVLWSSLGALGLWITHRRCGHGSWYWPTYRPVEGWLYAILGGPLMFIVSIMP